MTPAERKRQERERRRAAGLVRMELYIAPEHRDTIRRFAAKLAHETRLDEESLTESSCK